MSEKLPQLLTGEALQRIIKTFPDNNRKIPHLNCGAYDLVITHFEEPLEWMTSLPTSYRRMYVYHRGSENKKLVDYNVNPSHLNIQFIDRLEWICCKNIGRESLTIAVHAQRCVLGGDLYNKVADDDSIVFAQTFDPRHLSTQVQLPPRLWEIYTMATHFVANNLFFYNDAGHMPFSEEDWKHIQKDPRTFSQFFEYIFRQPWPGRVQMSFGNCFGTKVRQLRRHHPDSIRRLCVALETGTHTEAAHYMERLSFSFVGDDTIRATS